jgi:hypothetical protein
MRRLGLAKDAIATLVKQCYLQRVLPGVYAVGHTAPSVEADLSAALLYAGPGAVLSHATAAWWLALHERKPILIDVSTPSRRCSLAGIRVHGRRKLDRTLHKGLPVTGVAQTLLDYAATAPLYAVRHALAEAEFRKLLDIHAIEAMLGQGRTGSARLREALERHLPQLAYTRSRLERLFLALCEAEGITVPEVNAKVGRMTVDALWRAERVIVELDGYGGHASKAQIERDRRRELRLRALGFIVLRYTWEQVVNEPHLVATDLRTELARRGIA